MSDKKPKSQTKEEFPHITDLYASVAKRRGKKNYKYARPEHKKGEAGDINIQIPKSWYYTEKIIVYAATMLLTELDAIATIV